VLKVIKTVATVAVGAELAVGETLAVTAHNQTNTPYTTKQQLLERYCYICSYKFRIFSVQLCQNIGIVSKKVNLHLCSSPYSLNRHKIWEYFNTKIYI